MHFFTELWAVVGSSFVSGVMERYGTVSQGLLGLLRSLSGDRDRDPRRRRGLTHRIQYRPIRARHTHGHRSLAGVCFASEEFAVSSLF